MILIDFRILKENFRIAIETVKRSCTLPEKRIGF